MAYSQINVKAAAVTGAVLGFLWWLFAAPYGSGMMGGAYGSYYGMMGYMMGYTYTSFGFAYVIVGAVVGAIAGAVIAIHTTGL